MENILSVLPDKLRAALIFSDFAGIEEIRLRCGLPPTMLYAGSEAEILGSEPVTQDMLREILNVASEYSNYAVSEILARGFLTLPGGHRIGVCGSAVCMGGEIRSFRAISSVCIRVARAIPGAAKDVWKACTDSTLVIGPPGVGKTTLLRDLIYSLSEAGSRIAVVDERGEIAAAADGVPQLPVGRHTDVLSDCEKAAGMEMMLRTMNPQWIAVDEITAEADVAAMVRASFCGVRLLATAHAASVDELYQRPLYCAMMDARIFQYILILNEQKKWRLQAQW